MRHERIKRASWARVCTWLVASSQAANAGYTAPGRSPFDLVVIDEALEIFTGLHKRYGRDGAYDESSSEAMMAQRVQRALQREVRAVNAQKSTWCSGAATFAAFAVIRSIRN